VNLTMSPNLTIQVQAKRPRAVSKVPRVNTGEEAFLFWCKAMKFPVPCRNFRFMRDRKFEIDFAWPQWLIGVEIQGGIWLAGGGAHSRPAQILRDLVKHNLLIERGWRVWEFTPDQVISGEAVQSIAPAIDAAFEADVLTQDAAEDEARSGQ